MATDPICRMTVDEKTVKLKSEYRGKTYYFCAPGCKKNSMQTRRGTLSRECPGLFSSLLLETLEHYPSRLHDTVTPAKHAGFPVISPGQQD